MGFGYGPKMSQYRVDPAAFPKGPSKEHTRYLGPDDKAAIIDCFNRSADRHHGMMYKTEREMRTLSCPTFPVPPGYHKRSSLAVPRM